jgi:hypothetical protein
MNSVVETSDANKVTVDVQTLRMLFAGGNRSFPGTELDPLAFALDVIEHGAMELYTLHDALRADQDDVKDLASHAWRASVQLTAALELIQNLNEAAAE